MSSFGIIFGDELRGFMKSKAMIALWIGMPLVAILMNVMFATGGYAEYIPTTYFTQLIISSIGGILGVVSLSVTMTNEISKKVYDLFLIRPVKRWHIITAKFLAVFLNILIAIIISLALGMIVDLIRFSDLFEGTTFLQEYFVEVLKSIALSTIAIAICCASGLLIGTLIKNVAASAIVSVYLGQQLAQLVQLPTLFIYSWKPNMVLLFSAGIGLVFTAVLLMLVILAFNRKQF